MLCLLFSLCDNEAIKTKCVCVCMCMCVCEPGNLILPLVHVSTSLQVMDRASTSGGFGSIGDKEGAESRVSIMGICRRMTRMGHWGVCDSKVRCEMVQGVRGE